MDWYVLEFQMCLKGRNRALIPTASYKKWETEALRSKITFPSLVIEIRGGIR